MEHLGNNCSLCLCDKSSVFSMNCGHNMCEDCIDVMLRMYVSDMHCIYCQKTVRIVTSPASSVYFQISKFFHNIYIWIFGNAK